MLADQTITHYASRRLAGPDDRFESKADIRNAKHHVRLRPTVYVSLWTLRIVGITMNQNVPFIWRVNYRNKAASPETFLEIAHERARQYLRKNLSRMPVHKAV